MVEDVKVDISGPIFPAFPEEGSFHVSIITSPGPGQTFVGDVGSGFLPIDMGFKDQIFDFSGLSIVLFPGIEYCLEVTGGNLRWDNDTPIPGFGTLGLQLGCDPIRRIFPCDGGIDFYFTVPTLAQQISGSPVPEPSTWLLFATGLFLLGGLLYFNSGQKHPSLGLPGLE